MKHQQITLGFSTSLLHGDESPNSSENEPITQPIHVSSIFEHPSDWPAINPSTYNYGRITHPIRNRLEQLLGKICSGYALTYSSGVSAILAILLLLRPKTIAIRAGYSGTHWLLSEYNKIRAIKIVDIDDELQEGDLLWLESPSNPTGEIVDIQGYADKAHHKRAFCAIDATLAPPPLQNPMNQGVDIVMHSCTKYFGGHSDLIAGVVVTRNKKMHEDLFMQRNFLGYIPGSLESWLLLRSLRSLNVRVLRQADTAEKLAQWLHKGSIHPDFDGIPKDVILKVHHGSLQKGTESFVRNQMIQGHSPTFSIIMASKTFAKTLPRRVKFLKNASSLGGVESLIEWRCGVDPDIDDRLVRISIGLEDLEDLKQDFRQAFASLLAEKFRTKL